MQESQTFTKIDWLSFTMLENNVQCESLDDNDLLSVFDEITRKSRGKKELFTWEFFRKGGHGYTNKLLVYVGGNLLASAYYGGESQANTCYVDITGTGCAFIDWELAESGFDYLQGIVKRIDIALDFYDGEISLNDVRSAYEQGKIKSPGGGRKPSFRSIVNDYDKSKGDTIYIGSPKSGSMLRIYEKGKQLQLEDLSDWVRIEFVCRPVIDRHFMIPLSWFINNTDNVFAGAYPYFEELLPSANPIRLKNNRIVKSLERLADVIKYQWGSIVKELEQVYGRNQAFNMIARDKVKVEHFRESDLMQ